jgi:hypothetical protein
MVSEHVVRVRKAPWGRKRYFVPLPILSVLLLVTVAAAPSLLHATFNVYNDGALSISATIQSVVHPGGPTGKLTGFVTVTNHHPFAILLTSASVVITAGKGTVKHFHSDGFTITIKLPTLLLIEAGDKVKVSFSGSFTGSLFHLSPTGTSFLVVPNVHWFEVHSPTHHHKGWSVVGPFTYAKDKVCTVKATSVFSNGWGTVCSA